MAKAKTISDPSGDDKIVRGRLIDPSHDDRIVGGKHARKTHKKGHKKGHLPAALKKFEFKKGHKAVRKHAGRKG